MQQVQQSLGQWRLYYAAARQAGVKQDICEAFELESRRHLKAFIVAEVSAISL